MNQIKEMHIIETEAHRDPDNYNLFIVYEEELIREPTLLQKVIRFISRGREYES